MLNLPVFKIIPLIESFYIEQIGNKRISIKEYRSVTKSINKLKKSTSDPLKWVIIKTENKETPVLLKKSGESHIFLTGPLRLKKAQTEKDIEYWKKKLLDSISMEKSLEEILFPGVLVKSLSENVQNMLIKAKGFAVGTKRTWRGKEYKKVPGGPSGKGKWVRTYSETESRGAQQAIRNVQRKIQNASSMEELMQIVRENASRFKDDKGQMLPIVKEFITAVRGTDLGEKEKLGPVEAISRVQELKNLVEEAGQTYNSDINKIMRSFQEADLSLRAGSYMGKKLTKDQKERLERDVDSYIQKIKDILEKKKNPIPEQPIDEATTENLDRKRQFVNGSFEMGSEEAEKISDRLNDKISIDGVEFAFTDDDGDVTFYAEVDRKDVIDNIIVNPYDIVGMDTADIEAFLSLEGKGVEPEPILDVPIVEEDKTTKEELEKNSFTRGDRVKAGDGEGQIVRAETSLDKKGDPNLLYLVKLDSGRTVVFDSSEVSLLPFVEEKAQESIKTATPSNRVKTTMEISGTTSDAKTNDEVIETQAGVQYAFKPTPIKMEIELSVPKKYETDVEKKMKGKVLGEDYTSVPQISVGVLPSSSYRKVEEAKGYRARQDAIAEIRPDYIPEIDMKKMTRNKQALLFAKVGDNQYLIPTDQTYSPQSSYSYGPPSFEESFQKNYALVNLDVLAATQDFYRRVAKAEHNGDYNERVSDQVEKYGDKYSLPKKKRMKILANNRMIYDQQYIQQSMMGDTSSKDSWKTYSALRQELSQKTWDMQTMQEEIDNSYSKGNETAYGDVNTSDALKGEYGVKIKRQNGSDISPEDEKFLSNAMSSIQNTFGARKSMNDKFGLKLSYAKGTSMHASKAVGIFIPTQHAIGISDGKGLKKKDPFTGSMRTVDYGDENFGGFVLSHEYAHMMDSYLGSSSQKWHASDDYSSVPGQVAMTFKRVMKVPKEEERNKPGYSTRTCECFARAFEQYHAMETAGDNAMSFHSPYTSSTWYCSKEDFNKEVKPLIEKFFKENDQLLKSIDIIW